MAIKPAAEVADWWAELSPEGQAEYIAEHPGSKKAAQHRETQQKEKESRPSHQEHKNHEDKKANPDAVKHYPAHQDTVKGLHEKTQKFFADGQDNPGSPARKKVAHHIKKKSGILVSAIKRQVKEWKGGCAAIKKLAKREELTPHDTAALKALVKDVLYTMGSVAIGGGLAHGIVAAAHHVGYDVVKDLILKSIAHTAVENASVGVVTAALTDDKALKAVIDALADAIENGKIPKDAWVKSMGYKKAQPKDSKAKGKPTSK